MRIEPASSVTNASRSRRSSSGNGRPGEREHVAAVDALRLVTALGVGADLRVGDPVAIVADATA